MVDLDTALKLLENPTRREILRRLVREPHYPFQLADLIEVSQQAIVKHLNALERAGMVERRKVKSDLGGPPRNQYSVTMMFSLRLDIGPDIFHCEQRNLPNLSPMRLSERVPEGVVSVAEQVSGRRRISFEEGMEHLSTIDQAIETLDRQRDALISLHQQVRRRVGAGVEADVNDYEERRVMHALMERPGTTDLDALLTELRRTPEGTMVIDQIRDRLSHHLARTGGNIISGNPRNLPWYLMLSKDR